MPDFTLQAYNGKIAGTDESSQKYFIMFKQKILNGETISVKTKRVRSAKHHRFYFVLMNVLFDHNNTFSEPYAMRKWLEIEAGHYLQGVDGDGVIYKIPKSIDYASLEESDFAELHNKIQKLLLTDHVANVLFHESKNPVETADMILKSLIFERGF